MSRTGPKPKTARNTPSQIGDARAWDDVVCPDNISLDAKREWESRLAELRAANLLSRTSPSILRLYIYSYQRWLDAGKEIRKTGLIVSYSNGASGANPAINVEAQMFAYQRRLLNDMGLTPSSSKLRRQATSNSVDPDSKWKGILKLG